MSILGSTYSAQAARPACGALVKKTARAAGAIATAALAAAYMLMREALQEFPDGL